MLKKTRIIAGILMLATLILTFSSCSFLKNLTGGNSDPKDKGTGEGKVDESFYNDPKRSSLKLTLAELSQYTVIYPDSTDRATISAADLLTDSLIDICGVKNIKSETDYVGRNETVPVGTKEILVGTTNRPETVMVRYLDYVVTNENGRIVISGGSGEKNVEAVQWFLNNCFEENTVTVPGWERSSVAYPNENMTVSGIPLKKFSVPMQKGDADDTLREYLGKEFGIVNKSDEGYEIKLVSDNSVNATEYAVKYENKTLTIVGSSTLNNLNIVVNNVMESIKKTQDNTITLTNSSPMVISGQLRSVSEADIAALRQTTDQRIAEIESTANMTIPAGATVYYVSPNGNDANNGKSPSTAWKTITKVNSASISSGSYVCFERGGLWRSANLVTKSGVTYTAYGTGAKPVLCGSPEDGAVASKWKRAPGASDIWYYVGSDSWKDVGTMVFNGGESCAVKIVRRWEGSNVLNYTLGGTFNRGYLDLNVDLTFFHDVGGTGLLYLCSEENPGTRFKSIEFNVKGNLISVNATNNVTITNLAFVYGGSHGVGANGTYLKNLTVKNCTFHWIGGSVQSVMAGTTWETRFGNGVEIYGGCENYTVENCYFNQIYDAAVTHQWSGVGTTVYNAKNVRYVNNIIENAVYSVEYFYSDCAETNPSVMDGLLIEGNYMWNASYGFCEQRPEWDHSWGAHIKGRSSGSGNRAKNYVIKNNYFIGCKDRMLQITSNLYNTDGSDSMPSFSGNVFVLEYGKKFGQVEQRSDPGTQTDSRYNLDVASYLGNKSDGTDQYWFAPDQK